MLDHVGLTVSDFAKSRAFYDAALAPLGIAVIMEVTPEQTGGGAHAGYGSDGNPYFWIGTGGAGAGHVHVAFTAKDRATVDAFYAAALGAGGRDNGPPGIREHYHPNYYGAFVLDLDGHNVEAVCHQG
jgi:catechol 2,3-dioxygenase-like lactoylglutathione lyase family enzyme